MCLGVSMRVIAVDRYNAECEAHGVRRTVSLFMIGENEVKPGDHVMVHVGYALRKMSAEDAHASWALLTEWPAVEGV